MPESWRYRRSVRGPIGVQLRRGMTLEGFILKSFVGWDVLIRVIYTVKAAVVRWCNLGFGGSTNWMLWHRRTKWTTFKHRQSTNQCNGWSLLIGVLRGLLQNLVPRCHVWVEHWHVSLHCVRDRKAKIVSISSKKVVPYLPKVYVIFNFKYMRG